MNPWTLLVNLLGSTLSFFYDIIPEYGIAIIFLTLLVGVLRLQILSSCESSFGANHRVAILHLPLDFIASNHLHGNSCTDQPQRPFLCQRAATPETAPFFLHCPELNLAE